MNMVTRVLIVVGCLLLIPVTAVTTAAVKQRFADGPNRLFSGGPLVAGELHAGPAPDWSFVREIPTIELQMLDPPRRWPVQAARDGRAVLRIDGKRYERRLVRIESGEILDGITDAIRDKYPSQVTRASVEAGGSWVYWCIAAALVVTILSVLFVPGVDDFVERTFQGFVGRAAR